MYFGRTKYRGSLDLKSLLKVMRWPNLVIIILTQYFTAIFLIGDLDNWKYYFFDYRLFLLSFSTALIAAAGYIINDYYDIKIDYINKPEKVIIGKIIKRRVALAIHVVLNVIAFGIGILLSLTIGLVHFISIFLLWFYSNHLKRLPLIGNFIVALLTGTTVLILALLYHDSGMLLFIYAIFAFTITLIREIIKDMEDLKGDANFGCRTLPVIWGIRKSKRFLYFIILGFLLALFLMVSEVKNPYLNNYFILFLVPMFYFTFKLIKSDSRKNFNYLSNFCKLLMISGILSMIFFK